jgi:tetratricopeptide (TPR) repeat protein
LGNALVSYFMYLTTTFWPSGLAYFYPYSFELPLAQVIGGALLLVVWTVCVFLRVRQQPGLLVGWLWFVGTLVPTIGVVQFCIQARADRYTYIPSIGLFLVVVWGACELAERWTGLKKYLPVAGGLALAGCVAVSSIQITYWQNSLTLSRHAIAVTEGNYVAFESLGRTISAMGQPEHAIPFFADASRLAPSWPQGQFNYGLTLSQLGQTNDAIDHLRAAVKLVPGYAPGRTCLGQALLKFGRTDEAIQEFAEAARLDPQSAEAQLQWGTALTRENHPAEAADHLRAALRLAPGLAAAKTALEQILSSHPDLK